VERDARIPRSRRPIAVEDGQTGNDRPYSISPLVTRCGIALSESKKAEALADNLGTQFQPVTDPSVPTFIEMFDVALRSIFLTPASEPNYATLTKSRKPSGVSRSTRPGPERYPEQGLEASSLASCIPPGPDLHCSAPHPSFPFCGEARSSDLNT